MVDVVKNNLDKIIDACKSHHVKSLYLFGSAATGKFFSTESDLDFLYQFEKNAISPIDYADNFFDFKFFLEDLFDRSIDLISEEYLSNPSFIKSLEKSKVQVYAA